VSASPAQTPIGDTRISEPFDWLSRRAAVRAARFDLCLYNAGMDPYEKCPMGGMPGITRDVLARRERLVFAWCQRRRLPVAFVLAGGYVGPRLDGRASSPDVDIRVGSERTLGSVRRGAILISP
jgi:hypothetical protein